MVVWDTWLQQTAEASVYTADEEQFAVPSPQSAPAKNELLSRVLAQHMTHVPTALPADAQQQPQRSGAGLQAPALPKESAEPARMDGHAGQPKDPRARNMALQGQKLANTIEIVPATSSLAPTRCNNWIFNKHLPYYCCISLYAVHCMKHPFLVIVQATARF